MSAGGPPDPSSFPPGWSVVPFVSPPRFLSTGVMLLKDGEVVQAFNDAWMARWFAHRVVRDGIDVPTYG